MLNYIADEKNRTANEREVNNSPIFTFYRYKIYLFFSSQLVVSFIVMYLSLSNFTVG